jgi:hypothetical protein
LEVNSLIVRSFDLAIGEDASEEDLLKMLTLRVTEMMEGDVDLLMSYLYRLDIDAEKINAVLSLESVLPPSEGLARLILERQKQRIATKKQISVDPIEDGWEW